MPMKRVEAKYNEDLIKIGLKIASFRKLKGLTQEQLAEKTGDGRSTISNIENSDKFYSMSLGTLFRIADALDVPMRKLFDFRDTED